jgi:tetratricopeptide (TPR) repeat protein
MALASVQHAPVRHPWLDDLVRTPEAELRALIGGYADIAPFGRDEPADAAVSLLYGLPEDDPALLAFDTGCLALLETLRRAIVIADASVYERQVADFHRLLAVIRRVEPTDTVRDLHGRYAYWFHTVETSVVDAGLDLRREFWRLLALTQDAAAPPRRYLALWLDICAESGLQGRFDATYLDVGLLGLRRLPLGDADASNEEAACHGIARWAARQRPVRRLFLDRWREVESAYPRNADYWPPLVDEVIAATEEHLTSEVGQPTSFPAVTWWRDELDLPRTRPGQRPLAAGRRRTIEPPPREVREAILRDGGQPVVDLRPRIQQLMQAHQSYADHTGDIYYLVRTACNIGMRLIRREFSTDRADRGGIAADLAREALRYAPHNVYAWALWRDGLAAGGSFEAAETVGWKALKRYPENPQWRTQLALLIGDRPDRIDDAARLLRQTIDQFPGNAVARTQLATVLADGLGLYDQAVTVLREAIQATPDDPFGYSQLAILLADHLSDKAGAADTLRTLLRLDPNNQVAQGLLDRLQLGQRLRNEARPRRTAEQPLEGRSAPLDLETAAPRARRALFRFETATGDARADALREVTGLLADDPAHPYLCYVAQRAGIDGGAARFDTTFAFAFDRAARAGSAAAFDQLLTHVIGVNRMVADAGRELMATQWVPPATAANDQETESLMRRFVTLKQGFRVFQARPDLDRNPALQLLSDFAASDLALGLVA